MPLEICYLSVFEKTITLMVSKQSLIQFTVDKTNQLVRLILGYEHLGKKHWYSIFCSLSIIIKKTILHGWENNYTLDWCLLTWLN